jgi:hypothetical protein
MRAGTKIILGAALLALLLIAGNFFLSEVSFSPANPSWDGASCVMTGDTRLLYGFDGLPPGDGRTTLLIVGPTANYTPDDASRVLAFLRQGGSVVVMDDFGTANDLLSNIGAPITIRHTALCQDLDYYKKPSFPIVRRIENSSLTANVTELVFNHPAPLQITGEAEVLAETTVMGWLDAEGTGNISAGDEKFSSYPLIARAAYGSGELYVAGDADLAINAMQDQGDDGVLMGNVLRSGTVYLDVAHGQQVPPLAWLYYTIKYNIIAQILFALFIFVMGYAYVARGRILPRREPEAPEADPRGALIASMQSRLPLSDREIEEFKKKL